MVTRQQIDHYAIPWFFSQENMMPYFSPCKINAMIRNMNLAIIRKMVCSIYHSRWNYDILLFIFGTKTRFDRKKGNGLILLPAKKCRRT